MKYKTEQPHKQRETGMTPKLEKKGSVKTLELGEIKLNVSSLCEGLQLGVTLEVYCRYRP